MVFGALASKKTWGPGDLKDDIFFSNKAPSKSAKDDEFLGKICQHSSSLDGLLKECWDNFFLVTLFKLIEGGRLTQGAENWHDIHTYIHTYAYIYIYMYIYILYIYAHVFSKLPYRSFECNISECFGGSGWLLKLVSINYEDMYIQVELFEGWAQQASTMLSRKPSSQIIDSFFPWHVICLRWNSGNFMELKDFCSQILQIFKCMSLYFFWWFMAIFSAQQFCAFGIHGCDNEKPWKNSHCWLRALARKPRLGSLFCSLSGREARKISGGEGAVEAVSWATAPPWCNPARKEGLREGGQYQQLQLVDWLLFEPTIFKVFWFGFKRA